MGAVNVTLSPLPSPQPLTQKEATEPGVPSAVDGSVNGLALMALALG